jgi:hypothetical protein
MFLYIIPVARTINAKDVFMKKNKTVFFMGLTALTLVSFLSACTQVLPTEDTSSQDSPTPPPAAAPAAVQALPAFSGSFVSSQEEASSLVAWADSEITSMIPLTLPSALNQSGIASAKAAGTTTTIEPITQDYDENGIKATLSISISENETINIAFIGTIDKTENGATIKGGFNIAYKISALSGTSYSMSASYKDTAYTISAGGKGLKVVMSGELAFTADAGEDDANPSINITKSTLRYTVYDNNNIKKYDITPDMAL